MRRRSGRAAIGRVTVALAAVVLILAAGCTRDVPSAAAPVESPVVSPFQACPATTGPGRGPLALTVPCFGGEASVAIAGLGRPAILNLWASWCAPCRAELPEFQRFSEQAGEKVIVLGVVTKDGRRQSASLAVDLGITFPTVYDANSTILVASKAPQVLPVTLFVDASGAVVHQDLSGRLSAGGLRDLARQYLGVELA